MTAADYAQGRRAVVIHEDDVGMTLIGMREIRDRRRALRAAG
jgi:hypothetical protein